MKTITLIVRQVDISRLFPQDLRLSIGDDTCILDVIKAFDREINNRHSKFPVKRFKSLLHMIYHSLEEELYKRVRFKHTSDQSRFQTKRKPESTLA
jgi:hypothetical protein